MRACPNCGNPLDEHARALVNGEATYLCPEGVGAD
jgi:predicted RNA-binding Zn-ribbon protein involved in translation (DUF1610 family)